MKLASLVILNETFAVIFKNCAVVIIMHLIELLKNDWRNIFEMLLGGVKRNHYFPCIIWHQLSSTHMIIFDGNGLCLPTTTMHSLQNLAFCQICHYGILTNSIKDWQLHIKRSTY